MFLECMSDDSKLQRMQFGVAKKIKNSARKIVLDQAEEARLAAFSALKSLGVHVPQFSRPLLSDIVESPGGGKMPCFGEDPSKDVQPAESPLADHKIVNSDGAFPIGNREIVAETMQAAGETSLSVQMQYNGNDTDVGSLIKRETANHVNAAIEVRVECNPGDKDGLNGNNRNKKSEGPISASSFPGGFDCFLDKFSMLVEVLADMEHWGMGVDMEACLRERHVLMRKLKELEKEAYRLAGMAFSLYTAADIANVLYTHLNSHMQFAITVLNKIVSFLTLPYHSNHFSYFQFPKSLKSDWK
ncbi:hypothetical protein B296_00030914 [Ensete ventricosum]|uniref:Uncharacterized protein n=1 Tax=Ensete ventricosum TaxID=4639 RepID=A0A427AHQ1_ENSVE|nr:hypothetical protein B296_00030914 [Ensete ventricosum]